MNIRPLAKQIMRQPDWLAAFAVTLVILWLHFFFLRHAGGFWRDEVNLINLSTRHSLAEMEKDSFPVLMPALVGGWTAVGLGSDDRDLRLLGVLIGLTLPAALWFAAWKIRRSPPLLGLLLLGFNTVVIGFGDSLRAFGLGGVTILLTAAGAALVLRKPTWPRALGLAALATLSVQALYQNAVFVAAICAGAWAVCLRRKNLDAAIKILAVAVISAASLLPYCAHILSMPGAAESLRTGFHPEVGLINLDRAMGHPLSQYGLVWEILALALMICAVMAFRRLTDETPDCQLPRADMLQLAVAVAAAFGFVWFAAAPWSRWPFLPVLLLVVAALDSSRWTKRLFPRLAVEAETPSDTASPAPGDAGDLSLFAGVTLAVAAVSFGAFLLYAALPTRPWYFVPLLALAAGCFEIGLPLSGRHARSAVLGFAAATCVGVLLFAREDLGWRFTNVDEIAQRLRSEAAPGDYIVVSPWYCGITFERYFKGSVSWNTLPPLADHTVHRYDLVRAQMQMPDPLQPVLTRISATLQGGHRVWMLQTGPPARTNSPAVREPGPAPLKATGWSDDPYNGAWSAQVAQFLEKHSLQYSRVYFSTNQIIDPENLNLDMAEGWKG